MVNVTLYSVPAPGQCIKGEDKFLGTVRSHMHKAPLTALAAGLEKKLEEENTDASVRIVDMQTQSTKKEKYGELDLEGLILEKYRVGCSFEDVKESVTGSDIIGINANFTHSRKIVADFTDYVNRTNKNATVVIGGTDATANPEYYLGKGADIVVRGEGEITFQNIIKNLDKGKGIKEIPNISYNNTRVMHNPKTFISDPFDMTNIPHPDLDIVDLSKYIDTGEGKPATGVRSPFISVETSRGCTQACSFCATPTTKGKYRFMEMDAIKDHFEYFKRKGVKTLLFQEDNILSRIERDRNGEYCFPGGRGQLMEIFNLAREMGFSWEFTNGLEFGKYEHKNEIDDELINNMFWSKREDGELKGCYRATIPLENLTDNGSELFKKLKPLGSSKEIISSLADTGVDMLSFNLIIGRPEDDEYNLQLSHERCLEVKDIVDSADTGTTTYFNVYNLSLLPGTSDFRKYRNLLQFSYEEDPEVVTFYLGSLKTENFSPLEITQARGSMVSDLNKDTLVEDFDNNRYITNERFDNLFRDACPAVL